MLEGALAGLRVVDATSFFAGPYSTMLLGDMGAEVIKVESPPLGDPIRNRDEDSGYSPGFAAVNRNKKSLCLDLRSPMGREVLGRLLDTADVLAVSVRPRSRQQLGLSYEVLSRRFPRLVYCSITAYGEKGVGLDLPGFDTTAQGLSGLLSLTTADFDKPVRLQLALSDMVTGLYACYGILGALAARERTGRGQYVSTSLLQASIALAVTNFHHRFRAERSRGKMGLVMRTAAFLLVAGDGMPFVVHLPPSPPKSWLSLTEALGRTDLREDARFQDNAGREKHFDVLHALLAEHVKNDTRAHWLERLARFDVPCAPVNGLGEVFQNPLVEGLGMLAGVVDPFGNEELAVGSPVELSDTPTRAPGRSPMLGEHGSGLLYELGYADSEIENLVSQGVVLIAGLSPGLVSADQRERPMGDLSI